VSDADQTGRLIERGDLDELTRHVDRLARAADWSALLDLRDRCLAALARGKQLWPIATHAEFRLALEAPGAWAAKVLETRAGHFAPGPLAEVAGSTHRWSELAPHVPETPVAALAAHERVVRGEDLRRDTVALGLPPVLELPFALEPWEPQYALAEYHPDRVEFPRPPLPHVPTGEVRTRPGQPDRRGDPHATVALTDLVGAWSTESNGRAEASAVNGRAADAVRALGAPVVRMVEVGAPVALAWMAWAASSGGAHGRRRGAAAGRFAVWWTLTALAGLADEWPVEAEELGEVATDLRYYRWDAGEPETGWVLRLAIEDPAEGLAWAVGGVDSA
jgi:Family of unknown function (DUF6183)